MTFTGKQIHVLEDALGQLQSQQIFDLAILRRARDTLGVDDPGRPSFDRAVSALDAANRTTGDMLKEVEDELA